MIRLARTPIRLLRQCGVLFALPICGVLAQTTPDSKPAPSPGAASTPAAKDPNAWSALPHASSKPSTSPAAASIPVSDSEVAASTGADLLPPGVTASPGPGAPMTPSQNVTINLINRLVQRGVLTKEDAAELIQQAEADAQTARDQAAATQEAVAQAQAAAQQAVAQTPPPPTDDGTVRVTYVPDIVKSQISTQVKDEVMAQAREEGWAAPKLIPIWLPNFRPFADIRVRYEIDDFPSGNDNSGAFPNFNAINTGPPFNVAGTEFSPQLNVDQNRNRLRLRARFGADLNLGEGFTSGVRIATGDSNSPVSANQSLGLPYQGQGGNFSKYAIWLDRAFIKYELGGLPTKNLALTFGRFDNPFFTVSQIMWDDDIGFDGAALQGKYEVLRGFTPFIAGGLFPVFNTDLNFSSNQPAKFKSYDKWLYAAQLGADWKINRDFEFKAAGAYYYFHNIEGKLSSPFTPLTPNDAGDTDASRPAFAQKGNTYMALRNIVPNASNNFGTINQWQYFGLATPFRNIAFNAKLDYKHFEPFIISLSGEWVQNVAFDKGAVGSVAVNNRGANDTTVSSSVGPYVGGDTAWIVQMQVGSESLSRRWDWNISGGYRYVESDAVVDGFNDSDFGGGGTNLKGFTIGGNLALSSNVWFGIRYLSASSIAGPPFKEDIIQFDLNARF
ncbi:MAG: putative porin [Terrimicrobiaceae bacterium]|nr:putative porin [Terrimicrobiaceae bacterium]